MAKKIISLRSDIQLLRALAVTLVIAHHAKFEFFKAGYLGVDIFFVISGFLISRILMRDIADRNFSFKSFFERRARRLLPAAYCTFAATTLISPLVLTSSQLHDFIYQLAGALSYTINFFLWKQAGYFDGASDLKPLLHIWSLSVEEQFYVLMPILFILVAPRHWPRMILALFTASAVAFAVGYEIKPSATFYLLPTRAWELLAGTLCAIAVRQRPAWLATFTAITFAPAICTLLVLPVYPISYDHPSIGAFLVCLATAIVILADRQVPMNAGSRFAIRIGNGSYALYLVHWPIFSLLNNCFLREVPLSYRIGALAGIIVMAALLRKYIEKPFLAKNHFPGRKIIPTAVAGAAIMITLPVLALNNPLLHAPPPSRSAHVTYGFDASCNTKGTFTETPACRKGQEPTILVWGDSFAMHLVPGIADTSERGMVQATRVNCPPFLDLAPVVPGSIFNRKWAESCIAFNQSVLDYIKRTPGISTVILASPFDQNIPSDSGGRRHLYSLSRNDGIFESTDRTEALALIKMQMTIQRIREQDKRVVVVAPPPSNGQNVARCVERNALRLPTLDAHSSCKILLSSSMTWQMPTRNFLAKLEQIARVPVIYLDNALCSGDTCVTQSGGNLIYADAGHLSQYGSIFVARKQNLGHEVFAQAR